nr:NCS2 family permease [Maliibacterium massiliense]
MKKFFKLKEHNTNVRTEITAGVTTFFTMAYCIFMVPSMLEAAGMDTQAVMIATCIAAAVGTLLTAFIANAPFAQGPGIGLTAFFAYTVCGTMGYTWREALAVVLISGILFLIVTASPLRRKVVNGIPMSLKSAIGAGIGLFIALIGMKNAGIMTVADGNIALGNVLRPDTAVAIVGLIITGILMARKVKGALFIGIIVSTLIALCTGVAKLPESVTLSSFNLAPGFLQFDFAGLFSHGIVPVISVILTFAIIDMFDTVGTLVGTAKRNNMLDEKGELGYADRALLADAGATVIGSCLGVPTVTTYVESSAGISEGGRTGLSSLVTGLLFLLAVLLAPIAGIVPAAATAPALIIVGVLMIGCVKDIHWDQFDEALPAFLTIAMMPFAYSIADGIAFGFIFYVIMKLVVGKPKEIPALMYILSAIFILRFVLVGL